MNNSKRKVTTNPRSSLVAHQAGVTSRFLSTNRLGVILLLQRWDACP